MRFPLFTIRGYEIGIGLGSQSMGMRFIMAIATAASGVMSHLVTKEFGIYHKECNYTANVYAKRIIHEALDEFETTMTANGAEVGEPQISRTTKTSICSIDMLSEETSLSLQNSSSYYHQQDSFYQIMMNALETVCQKQHEYSELQPPKII